MPTSMKLSISAFVLAAGVSACAGKNATDLANQDDFKRDLQLASSTVSLTTPKVDPSLLTLETKPQGAPLTASVVKKGAGTRAVRSKTPTVKAAPQTDVAASDESSSQVDVLAEAPAPEVSEPVAVAPRPSPVPVIQTSGDGSGDYGTSGNGGGIFGPGGGIGGVVIRGGGVDGDHCEIHGARRPRNTGGVYMPPSRMPGTVIGSGGGMGTSRRGGMGGIGSRIGGSGISSVSRPSGVTMRRGR